MLQGGQVITGIHSMWHNRYAIYATVYTQYVHNISALYEDNMSRALFCQSMFIASHQSVVAAEVYVYCAEVLFPPSLSLLHEPFTYIISHLISQD